MTRCYVQRNQSRLCTHQQIETQLCSKTLMNSPSTDPISKPIWDLDVAVTNAQGRHWLDCELIFLFAMSP